MAAVSALSADDLNDIVLSLLSEDAASEDTTPGSPASTSTEDLPLPPDTLELSHCAPTVVAHSVQRKRALELAARSTVEQLPPAVDDESRKARRMARNRRAAATSRARKKEHLEVLQMQLDALQAENRELRQRLMSAGLMNENEKNDRGGRWPVYAKQPAVLLCETHSLQLECTQPLPPMIAVFLLALLLLLCLPRQLSRCLSAPRCSSDAHWAQMSEFVPSKMGCTTPTRNNELIPTCVLTLGIADNPPRRLALLAV
mmetsp:Transcript_17016/g.28425  ORF Transcript_17016/g.28425 Transcript_17016/m.28425 type:complete len:258 (-) Transcript_17016:187-960(-)|eukprot:CAMPEP_0119310418 /NCGR_PEP_ID=MMETSP1333-20130426/19385_1 /TAXON_ID=418940 /ORGANISM="Scyphosphaera apsteinii, Strain RCC1455" /LENGTH=257 /DNA_ID=CAMNT_0007314601 /DNA_START=116 /DNA_END=889 /DNA_ORIENTATION=+